MQIKKEQNPINAIKALSCFKTLCIPAGMDEIPAKVREIAD